MFIKIYPDLAHTERYIYTQIHTYIYIYIYVNGLCPSWLDVFALGIDRVDAVVLKPRLSAARHFLTLIERYAVLGRRLATWAIRPRELDCEVQWIGCHPCTTFQSYPPCPVLPDHGDVHWPGHRAQKQASDWNNWNGCMPSSTANLALYVAKKKLVSRWSTLLEDCVLPDGDARTGFHALTELDPRFIRPLNVFSCIRKSSCPECMRLIWISPALRILSQDLFIDIDLEEFIFCAASCQCRSPWCSLKPVLLRVDHHQVLERIVWHFHVLQDQEIWDMLPSVLRSVVQLWAFLAKLCVVAEVAPGRSCWASRGW